MIPLQKMSSRQKDKFIDQVLRMSDSIGENEGFARSASTPISGAIMAKAENEINATLNGLNGLKRMAFAINNCVALARKSNMNNLAKSVELPTQVIEVDNTEERLNSNKGSKSVETIRQTPKITLGEDIGRTMQECIEVGRNVQSGLEEDDRIQCMLCNRSFINLGKHLASTHKVSVVEYKKQHNLNSTVSPKLKQARAQHTKDTFTRKYGEGVTNASHLPTVTKKIQASRKRNGYFKGSVKAKGSGQMGFQRQDIQDKCTQSLISKYGGKGLGSAQLKQQARETCLERYGVTNPMKVQAIAHKCFSKQCNRPNYPEKVILGLGNGKLLYTGDASFKITLKNGKVKYPDFIVDPIKDSHKIVEHYGEHFHTKEEQQFLDKAYREVGYTPLFIWHEETKDLVSLEKKLSNFILNQ